MKRKITYYIYLLITILFTVTSCINEEDDACPDEKTLQVHFAITMYGNNAETRAGTWGDTDYDTETANEWESSIQVNKLQVLVYDINDQYIGKVDNVVYSRRTGTERNVYDILGTMNVNEELLINNKLTCKFVVFANYDSPVPEQTVGADLADIKDKIYTYNATAISNKEAYIPMWGVQTYVDTNTEEQYKALVLKKGERTEAGDIFMLRAMSKIRIKLSDKVAAEFKMSNVSLTNYNALGYIVPKGYNISETKDLYYDVESGSNDISYNPYTLAKGTSLDFQVEKADSSYIVYVPEGNTETLSASINVTLTSKTDATDTKDYVVKVADYDSDGKATTDGIDLVRNTIYEYVISNVGETKPLIIAYKVMPWIEGGTYNIEYKFESTLAAEKDYRVKVFDDSSKAIAVTYAASNAGNSPWLTLAVETSYQWKLHIDNPYFSFLVDDGGTGTKTNQISYSGDKEVRFKVVPLSAIDYSDATRNYKATIFLTATTGSEVEPSRMPINSGSNQLPNGDEYEVVFYQVSSTEFLTLSSPQ